MLFIQSISIGYYKNMRFPQYANERERILFLPIELNPHKFIGEEPPKDNMLDCEVLVQYEGFWQYPAQMHHNSTRFRQFGEEIFTEGSRDSYKNMRSMIGHLRLSKEDGAYRVRFCDEGYYSFSCPSRRRGHNESYNEKGSPFSYQDRLNETAFVLKDGDYGRIIFNNRYVSTETGIWCYERGVYNIINCNKAAFREKMFYRKKPDFEYTNLLTLR
ncbi:MAG: hypothetical protein KBA55_06660 [Ruminococcus sp.]|nr:hypothetical protein [Ruminococcus sp.]